MSNARPALNVGIQYAYLKEQKRIKGSWSEEDLEIVYPGIGIFVQSTNWQLYYFLSL